MVGEGFFEDGGGKRDASDMAEFVGEELLSPIAEEALVFAERAPHIKEDEEGRVEAIGCAAEEHAGEK